MGPLAHLISMARQLATNLRRALKVLESMLQLDCKKHNMTNAAFRVKPYVMLTVDTWEGHTDQSLWGPLGIRLP